MWKAGAPLRWRAGRLGRVATCRHRRHPHSTEAAALVLHAAALQNDEGEEPLLPPLSPEQQQIVQMRGGAAVVAAGPGTGKTHVLAARVVALLKSPLPPGDAAPRGVLALTFTQAAARTLRQRVERAIPIDRVGGGGGGGEGEAGRARSYEICTMHAFAKRAIAEYHLLLGLPYEPTILSRAEQSLFLSRILHRLPLRLYAQATGLQTAADTGGDTLSARLLPSAGNAETRRFVSGLISFFGRLQERGLSAQAYITFIQRWYADDCSDAADSSDADDTTATAGAGAHGREGEVGEVLGGTGAVGIAEAGRRELYDRAMELAGCYAEYERLKREQGMIDMGDMILQLHELLTHHPSAALALADRWDHVVVDEFQDLSPVQLGVVEQLWAARSAIDQQTDDEDDEEEDDEDENSAARVTTQVGGSNDNAAVVAAAATTAGAIASAPSLLVVGDDEQAIFQWRVHTDSSSSSSSSGGDASSAAGHGSGGGGIGGAGALLAGFESMHPGASVFELQHSYRSLPKLQQAADRLLGRYRQQQHQQQQQAQQAAQQAVQQQQGGGVAEGLGKGEGSVDSHRFDTAGEEAAWIAQRIYEISSLGAAAAADTSSAEGMQQQHTTSHHAAAAAAAQFGDIAVLCRHNHEARRIGKALAAAGIPTNMVGGGTRLFEVPRVAELLHLLAALVQWPGHGCYHLYSLLAAASGARLRAPAANSAESCLADLFGLPMPLLTALSSYNSQSGWPLRRLIEEAALGQRSQQVCAELTAVCGATLSAEAAQSMLMDLHYTLEVQERRVHMMPPSLLLSRLLEESGMAAAYAMAATNATMEAVSSGAIHAPPTTPLSSMSTAEEYEQLAQEAEAAMVEAAAVGKFLRYLAELEQERSLTGGGATDWAAATFLVPYLHSLREAGEEPAMQDDDSAGGGGGGGHGYAAAEGSGGGSGSGNSVDVLTIHKAKGLEWAHVFIACATQSHLGAPSSAAGSARRRRQPLGADLPMPPAAPVAAEAARAVSHNPLLAPSVATMDSGGGSGSGSGSGSGGGGGGGGGGAAEVEARRLFYVAMTRARESLTFTSARHYGGARARAGAGSAEEECSFVSQAIGPSQPEEDVNAISGDGGDGGGDSSSGSAVMISRADPGAAEELLLASHALMEGLFPPEDNHYLSLDALRGPDIRFFIAEGPEREEDDATESERERIVVGCGALAIRDGYGELKSMYITPGSRRRGVARNILTRLEEEAKAEGLSLVRLETGNLLRDALSLYRKMGFVDREAFGDYTANETSVFMEKRLT